jgi:hypothetical protein
MNNKNVVQLDSEGYYVGITEADESPLEPGVYLMPAGTIDVSSPSEIEGKRAKWINNNWIYEDLPEDPTTSNPLTLEQQQFISQSERQGAYIREADPLFFKWQRGEATEQEWLEKIAEIKARYPNPE